MGASQSTDLQSENEEDDNTEEEDDENIPANNTLAKKVIEQDPEMSPFYQASGSPLTPQSSSLYDHKTSELWDSHNILSQTSHLSLPRNFSPNLSDDSSLGGTLTEVYLICHGECQMNLRPDLVGGRCSETTLTSNGKRQSRALAAFFKSRKIQFNTVYTSPLDRARSTAISVCQEMKFPENEIQSSEAVTEMSYGDWEGCNRSEIFTNETINSMEKLQPDFCAPSGESLRQVEFRMLQFLNGTVMSYSDQNQIREGFSHINKTAPPLDSFYRHRKGSRKKSGKSRLQVVATTGGGLEADDEMSPRKPVHHHNHHHSVPDINVKSIPITSSCIGVFTHSVPIKCVITGILGCSAVMSRKICIDDSSVTVLQHSWKKGWQIKTLNDTSHLTLV